MPFQHDSKYYFEDGDIILRVSNTLFRVHREKLRAVKGLFEELFSLQQPADGEKIYGVPCCEISLVSATDMHFALGYIYEDV
jgi:hypothetical protein